ncbi:formyl transferase-like protein [Jezberella montanilacus]|jgi:methionyl-tRNA formyltransferase|uniref:Formyl transferase-like protein n=1 Tax=Jezberella montanilacus TaxID=323426 RepID=A0A2T0XIW7_9BURK|nr:formyltransferase family protein [Jezberella montanilacus]PRY98899.1 formyl transferase-like protein [Jezberella montanilacus]
MKNELINKRVRVAMLGSFYRGFYMLNELLYGDIAEYVEVVGVATDDPKNTFISPDKRVWRYPHTVSEVQMVETLAHQHSIEVYKDRVNSDPFYELFEKQWQPELCLMATFGQRIGKRLIQYPEFGFYNLHPCIDDKWPSKYVGGNPFNALQADGKTYTCVAFHAVDENFDTGPLIKLSGKIAIPPDSSVVDMHKITSYAAAKLAADEVLKLIQSNKNT